jgi:hypothetical protein
VRKGGNLEDKPDVLDGKGKLLFETGIIPVRRKIDAVEACVTFR